MKAIDYRVRECMRRSVLREREPTHMRGGRGGVEVKANS